MNRHWLRAMSATAALLLVACRSAPPATPLPAGAPSLGHELADRQAAFAAEAPAETVALYQQAIDDLRASEIEQAAVGVGDAAPDFTLPTADGHDVTLSELTTRGPVVLTWYRGGWCPYCNIALRHWQRALPELRATGATLVALTPELPDKTAATASAGSLEFLVVSDLGNRVAREYGLTFTLPAAIQAAYAGRIDLVEYNGIEDATLPLSATYLVDSSGTVRWSFVDADYRRRAEPADVLAVLRELTRKE